MQPPRSCVLTSARSCLSCSLSAGSSLCVVAFSFPKRLDLLEERPHLSLALEEVGRPLVLRDGRPLVSLILEERDHWKSGTEERKTIGESDTREERPLQVWY